MDRKETIRQKAILKLIEETKPDQELLAWEKWIEVRKEETVKLSRYTSRQPVDLTMNLLDRVREEKETKTVLEHAQIEKKPFLRGGLWEQPLRLKQACHCQPVYEVQRTDAEKGNPRIIEHIGVPNLIKETEMGFSGEAQRNPCTQLETDYINYRDKRQKDLEAKIKKIDPFRPSIGALLVRGTKPKPPPKKMPPLPTFLIDQAVDRPEVSTVYAVRINNTVIYKPIEGHSLNLFDNMKKETWHEDCKSWTYYFKVPASRAGRSKLYLENLGTVTLRYCWKKIKKPIPYIPEDVYDQVFFFNKNEDVLSPGQSKVIQFTCVSDKPGIFSEIWELSFCNICFFDALSDKFVFYLNADFVEDFKNLLRKVDVLKAIITKKALKNIAVDILSDIVTKATLIEPQIYPYENYFLESEMFLMKNPVCFYHQTEVAKMKGLYTEMERGAIWDLTISAWREKMMNKEYDDRMKYYELLRISHRELLKPWEESENVLQQKYKAMYWLLGQMADKIDDEYERVLDLSGVREQSMESSIVNERKDESILDLDPRKVDLMRHLFYMYAYEHVASTMEKCAGVLSSIDLNRWIHFDFCRV